MAGFVEGDEDLLRTLVGRKIVSVEGVKIRLDDGTVAELDGYGDCCAYAGVDELLLHPEQIEHAITGVRVEENDDQGVEVWHFMANMADVLDVKVDYSEGTGYYSFGIDVKVTRAS